MSTRGLGWMSVVAGLAALCAPMVPPGNVLPPPRNVDDESEPATRAGKPQFTPEEQAQLAKLSGKAKKTMVRELMAKHSKVAKWTS